MSKIIPIDRFFAEMELSEEEKRRREDLANELLILFLLLFNEIEAERLIHGDLSNVDITYYKEMLYRQYCDKVDVYILLLLALLGSGMTDEMREEIRQRTSFIVDTTLKYDAEFYTSKDRAIMLAENETNYVGNNTDYRIAKYQGYRHKKWLTMKDEKVRRTHVGVDESVKGIDEYYQVGLAEMLYPYDMSRNGAEHPEEWQNCRCTIQYLR